jgi:hypothetical protein
MALVLGSRFIVSARTFTCNGDQLR